MLYYLFSSLFLFLFLINSLSDFSKLDNSNIQTLLSKRLGENVELLDVEKNTEDINVLFRSTTSKK